MSIMRYRTFMAWTTPACITWAFLYVSIGSGAAETYRDLQTSVESAGWIFIAIVVASVLLIAVIKHVLHRYAQSHEATESIEVVIPEHETR
jgi:membrane protein DedA with SNARE-associated domain